jgi:AcrR family transcriptional regulator
MPSVTRKAQSSRAQRRQEIAARLLTVIEHELQQGESYTELSVERICAEAGIARSTFYTHFEDKGHLLRELTADVLGALGQIAAEWWTSGQDIDRDQIEVMMYRLYSAYREHDALLGAVADTAVYDDAVHDVFNSMIDSFIREITKMIERGRKQGWITLDASAKETATLLNWMVERTSYEAVRGAGDAQIKRIAQANAEILWKTLYTAALTPARTSPRRRP